jgi:hypothetical protein
LLIVVKSKIKSNLIYDEALKKSVVKRVCMVGEVHDRSLARVDRVPNGTFA